MDFYQQTKQIYIGKINTSETEIRDLIKAWVAISVAFAMIMRGLAGLGFYQVFIVAAITVGTGFLLHELGHKIIAQRYGCFAEFRSFDQMLILAIFMSYFFNFVFAAPGAVMIHGPVGKRRNGIISAAGPVVNMLLALLFLLLLPISYGFVSIIAFYGFIINSWLALFNMIPIWNLDGAKVLRWDKKVYGIIVATALLLMFLQNFISLA